LDISTLFQGGSFQPLTHLSASYKNEQFFDSGAFYQFVLDWRHYEKADTTQRG